MIQEFFIKFLGKELSEVALNFLCLIAGITTAIISGYVADRLEKRK